MIRDKLSPFYDSFEKKNAVFAAKLLSKIGVNFKRQFSLPSYKEFFKQHNISDVRYSVVEGHMPCAFAVIDNH